MEIRNPSLAMMATGNVDEDLFMLKFSKYIYSVIRGASIDYKRKLLRYRTKECLTDYDFDGKFLTEQSLFTDGGIDSNQEEGDFNEIISDELLLASLKCLSATQSSILHDSFVKEKTVQEIAGRLGRTEHYVIVNRLRALSRLRDDLSPNGRCTK